MKLVQTDMGLAIDIMENIIPLICVESPHVMTQMIAELYSQINGNEGNFVLSEDKTISFAKGVELLINPWAIDGNSKKIKAGLLQLVKESIEEDCYEKYMEVRGGILSLAEQIAENVPYSITYNEDPDISLLAKLLDFSIAFEETGLLQRLVEYMKLSMKMCGTKLFFLVNVRSFLEEEELELLLQEVMLHKITMIMLESHVPQKTFASEKVVIIDKDGCIITV